MSVMGPLVLVEVLTLLWSLSRGDTNVLCIFMETCILPCSFQGGADVIVHWTQMKTRQSIVHDSHFNQSMLALQDRRFRGRTSLFEEQLSSGNASLLLKDVQIQDQGRYKCLTDVFHTNEYSFVNLKVDAPVREVHIQQDGDQITCSSEGIYPEPNLTWSAGRPSGVKLTSTTIVQLSQRQLYNISSSLTHPDVDAGLVFNCTVSNASGGKTASLSSRVKSSEQHSRSGIAIGQVVAVVLVTVTMGLVPCFYHKCRARCSRGTEVV